MHRSMSRVYRSLESRPGLSWPQVTLLLVALIALFYVWSALSIVLNPPRIAPGGTDWKGDHLNSHYRDWRP